jgi:hypothetical protein
MIDAVQRELDWYFGAPRQTIELVRVGTHRYLLTLFLRQPPVITFPVTARTRYTPGTDWVVVELLDFEIWNRKMLAKRVVWSGDVEVTYHEGFITPPGDVAQLVLSLIAEGWRTYEAGGIDSGVTSERLSDYSYTLGGNADGAAVRNSPLFASVKAHWKRGRI